MQNLMELDYGWATLTDTFIFKVVQILSSPQSLINVCRPATAILKKLVEADPLSSGTLAASSSRSPPPAAPGSVYRYGFHIVFEQMRKERGLLETVVNRLGSGDTAMAQYRYALVALCHPQELIFIMAKHDAYQLAVGTRKRYSVGGIYFGARETERTEGGRCKCQ